MIVSWRPIRSANVGYDVAACFLCQWRAFSTSYHHLAEKSATGSPTPSTQKPKGKSPPQFPSPLEEAPRAYGMKTREFTPKPLSRPIGLPNPPKVGENTGVDGRTLKQRRDDFVDYDKHLARRKELTHKVAMPYFREWSNLSLHKGKTFFGPPRLFKSDLSLYFPNLRGQTLVKDKKPRDTTPLFKDKVSVVSIFNTKWAEDQAATFTSEKENPELHEVVKNSGGIAQMVQINFEQNWMKAMIVKMFMPSLRKQLGAENWGRYFLLRKGFREEIREAIGYLNTKVGYIYVLDGDCRIRWAGSGLCEGDEKDSLVKGVRRLVEVARAKQTGKAKGNSSSVIAGNKKDVTKGE